jgi:hypothetical protein
MACGCRGRHRGGAQVGEIIGYEYISPAGHSSRAVDTTKLMTLAEARVEQRAHGGGTIKGHRRLSPAR